MNTYFLWLLFRAAGYETLAINAGESVGPESDKIWDRLGVKFCTIDHAVQSIDVLIECAGQVSAEAARIVHARGGKAVTYKFGNSFVIETERIIHGKTPGAIINEASFDAVWTIPQHMHTCGSYWQTLYRCPVVCLPHIWEPTFVDRAVREFPSSLRFDYQPHPGPKRVGVFEPNVNMVKTCVIPMLACEEAHRARPDTIGDIYIANAFDLKKHLTFEKMAKSLDIVKRGKCSFEARYNTPWFLASFCDVMLAHHWECGLNYAYYDALYGGYPLVHNSELLPENIGYRYRDFDSADGGRALVCAMTEHDDNAVEYSRTAMEFLETKRPIAMRNIHEHERAIDRLFS